MRTTINTLLTVGSVTLLSAGVAMAGSPIASGNFTTTGGSITASCAGVDAGGCGTPITGDGFLQRSIVVGGVTYFQTIVLPQGASGSIAALPFADESFVKQGGGTGISDSSHVIGASALPDTSVFSGSTAINSGWAKPDASTNLIDLHQNVTDAPNNFSVDFTLTDASTDNTQPIVGITQNVALNTSGDLQKFYLKQLKAPSNGTSLALPAGATPGTTISWTAGDIIQAMWLGQQVTGSGTQLFHVQGYTDVTSTASNSYSDQTSAQPSSWDTTFGTAPTFP